MVNSASVLLAALNVCLASPSVDGNRLTYLDEFCNPYRVGLESARLTTPQWIGDPGVDAAIVLAIDDLKDTARYEAFLRPILRRLAQIDGRSPVSLMTTTIDPQDPQIQQWLREGLSVEVHTVTHPCPCLQRSQSAQDGLAAARDTFDRCVDLLSEVPGNRPVAFRMPCCDSMNSVSPRFFAEVFNKATPGGHFLAIDSSVFQVFTSDDPQLPRDLVTDEQGGERFRKYVPADRGMVNLVENYPYPYVVGRLAWEFPCLMPSDWDAQNLNGKCSPKTLRDLKLAVDATVTKQGVFSLCFHPHGWIAADQVVELIDYVDRIYGGRVKFLNFAEVEQRLTKNLLAGHPLRAADGLDNGVRLLDLDADGYMDVVIGNAIARQTRVWKPESEKWTTTGFPVSIVTRGHRGEVFEEGVRFGVLRPEGWASLLIRNEQTAGVWHYDGGGWAGDPDGLTGLDDNIQTASVGHDRGARLRDFDGDGITELLIGRPGQSRIYQWGADERKWFRLPFALPEHTALVDSKGRDAGLRFIDVDEDGHDDVVFSNAERYSLDLFVSPTSGWSRSVLAGHHGAAGEIPPFVRADGTNNGVWANYRHIWVQNEDTGKVLPGEVAGRSFAELLSAGR